MVRVSIVPISEGDLQVLAPSRPLFDHGPGVGFPGRGTVSPGCRVGSRKLEGIGLSRISGANGDPPLVVSPTSSLDLTKSLWTSSSLRLTWRSCSLTELVESKETTSGSGESGSPVDSPRRSGSRSWLRSGGGVLRQGVLLGTTLTGVLPAATYVEGYADAGASTLGPVEGCRGQWLGSSLSRAEVSARPFLVRVRKSANVGGDRDFLLKSSGERKIEREFSSSSFTYYRNECFIPVGGEHIRTPSLTFVVPRDMTEMYKGCATAAAWGKGMAHHATLMGVGLGSIVPDHLHLGYQIDCRPDPSG
ncbi:hypothetical protein BHM03_00019106 [Ensete ventricosum]|nr:hypothetical protein BHM03_00019106 [Ensete ventricosum]